MRRVSNTIVILILVLSVQAIVFGTELYATTQIETPKVETFRNGMQYVFMFSWDDGVKDLEFSFLEDERGFKHTSFVVTERMYGKHLWGLDMLFRGHDIQSHSSKHLHFAELNSSYREELLKQSVEDIQKLFGYTPILFAYPYGSQNFDAQEQVLEYFQLGRGIWYEQTSERGKWPITDRGYCKHSFPSIDGVRSSNMDCLISSFHEMVTQEVDTHRAYKCYGHTHTGYFTEAERIEFFGLIEAISNHDQVWYTSWGEAVAYEIERNHVTISDFRREATVLSFVTKISNEYQYGIPLSYRIRIPDSWPTFTVLDGDRITSDYIVKQINGKRHLILNSVPKNQRIKIILGQIQDDDKPSISNVRTISNSEGIAILADITDEKSYISNVNITVIGDEVYHFENVQNPIFWDNSTYGRVVFDGESQFYTIEIKACDSSGNQSTQLVFLTQSP
jgi:hypothetical protein